MTGPMWRMNQAEMRQAITTDLVADPTRSNRRIAIALGIDNHTVAAVRDDLEASSRIARLDRTVGADGRTRTARRTSEAKPKPVKVTFTLAPDMHTRLEALAAKDGDPDVAAHARRLIVAELAAREER